MKSQPRKVEDECDKPFFLYTAKTWFIILIIYIVLTYRVWGGYYYHHPHEGPYGFMYSSPALGNASN